MGTLFPKTIDLKQRSGAYVRGVWVENTDVEATFLGSVQPLSGKEQQALTVGRENLGKVKVFSNTRLKIGTEGKEYTGDVVKWKGKEWEVIDELDFQNDIINHYKYIGEYRADYVE